MLWIHTVSYAKMVKLWRKIGILKIHGFV